MTEAAIIDSDTVSLRLPEVEEDWNFVRSVYMKSYWDGGLERAARPAAGFRDAITEILGKYFPNRYLKKLLEGLEPTIIPMLRPPDECRVSQELFAKEQLAIRDRLIESSEIWLACSPTDAWFLLGFAIVVRVPSGIVLHYLYVKRRFRRIGLGLKLLEAVSGPTRYVVATHVTHDWCKWAPGLVAKGYRVEFNPYLLEKGDSK